jgi:hypothetical protein
MGLGTAGAQSRVLPEHQGRDLAALRLAESCPADPGWWLPPLRSKPEDAMWQTCKGSQPSST